MIGGLPKGCSHGKTFDEPCLACALVSIDEMIAFYERDIVKKKTRRANIVLALTSQKDPA